MLRFRFIAAAAVLVVAAGLTGHSRAATRSATTGVVLIETNLAYENSQAAGTGIVLTPNGEVVTNNHVIRGATTIDVVVPATNKEYTATVLGYDSSDDIALLKLAGASHLATATRGDSSKLLIGQSTRAVGNAQGAGKLVTTAGRVTGLLQQITVQNDDGTTAQLKGLVATSARLVPGDSGGPLLDARGRVIAIDAAGSPSYHFVSSDGYAIPIDRALSLVKQMRARQASPLVHIGKTAFLGISVDDRRHELAVGSVVPGGAAAKAGIEKGDVIRSLGGKSVSSLGQLRAILFAHHPGDTITLGYVDLVGDHTHAKLTLADGPPQ